MYIIIGCGFLGSYLLQTLSDNVKEQPIIATVRNLDHVLPIKNVEWVKCDVLNHGDLTRLADRCGEGPKTVYYFAAAHNIDEVYLDPKAARRVNIEALKTFFQTTTNIDKLFFASTDCVYGENDKDHLAFSEDSPTNPLNEYGKQKLEAEQIVRSNGFTVLRLPLMIGPSLFPQKQHFYDEICEKLRARQSVEMIDGLKRSLLSYQKAADLLFRLSCVSKAQLRSVINVCSDESFTKYEIGCLLAEKMQASKDLVCRMTESEGKKFFKDARASSTVMDNSLLKRTLGISSVSWEKI